MYRTGSGRLLTSDGVRVAAVRAERTNALVVSFFVHALRSDSTRIVLALVHVLATVYGISFVTG